jgi:tetratricopeptide (TPR) repeat protein
MAPTLEDAEIKRAQHKPTESLNAYDYYLRGMARFHQSTRASIDDALRSFRQAIRLDPDYAAAFGMASWCYVRRKGSRWAIDREQEITEATPLIRRALELGRMMPWHFPPPDMHWPMSSAIWSREPCSLTKRLPSTATSQRP